MIKLVKGASSYLADEDGSVPGTGGEIFHIDPTDVVNEVLVQVESKNGHFLI